MINCSVFILIGGDSKRFGSMKYLAKIDREPIINLIIKACENFKSYTLVGKNLPSELQDKSFIKDKHCEFGRILFIFWSLDTDTV